MVNTPKPVALSNTAVSHHSLRAPVPGPLRARDRHPGKAPSRVGGEGFGGECPHRCSTERCGSAPKVFLPGLNVLLKPRLLNNAAVRVTANPSFAPPS